jgi:ribonuclease BN (tRNA processing enzyme)
MQTPRRRAPHNASRCVVKRRIASVALCATALLSGSATAYAADEPTSAAAPALNRTGANEAGSVRVTLLGTGTPLYNPNRAGAATALSFAGKWVLVDAGNGAQSRLHEAGLDPRHLHAIAITHHHIDHNQELIPLVQGSLLTARPLTVIGPPGTREMVEFGQRFYAQDTAYRLGRSGRNAGDAAAVRIEEVNGESRLDLQDLKVSTAAVPHSIAAQAFRFDVGPRSIVVSGDLTYSESLIALARRADMLIIDGSGLGLWQRQQQRGAQRNERRPSPRQARDGADGAAERVPAHAPLEDLVRMARGAEVGCLVFTHIGADHIDEAALRNDIRSKHGFNGTVIVGHDLLTLDASCRPPP